MTGPRSLFLTGPMGSSAEDETRRLSGSDGVMTRAMRRRRLLAGSSVHLREKISLNNTVSTDLEEWRDWANLMPELIDKISERLLCLDVAEYRRFRAVCKPWRDGTDDPRGRVIDRRFRPRNWIDLCITPDPTPQRRLLNLATGASMGVEIRAFSTHCYLGAADGLLLLYHRPTMAIRLLDPLSNVTTEFPAISRSKIVVAVPPKIERNIYAVYRTPLYTNLIDGAALDDSTSPPSLVLCLRDAVHNIIFAKPGDEHWTLVSPGQASHWLFDWHGRITFQSLASIGGRCYFSSPEGSVYVLQLHPLPQLVEIVYQRKKSQWLDDAIRFRYIYSFLVGAGTGGKLLLMRYYRNLDYLGGKAAYSHREQFTVYGTTNGFMEMLEVDIARKRLVPLESLVHQAVFVGETQCVAVSTEIFPSIIPDAIYLGYRQQIDGGNFGICHLNSMRLEPAHEFDRDQSMRLVPRARPCNIDQYLVCYVDRRGMYSGDCIIHSQHEPLSECIIACLESSGLKWNEVARKRDRRES